MRCPSRLRLSSLHATFTLLVVCTAAACSGANSGAGATAAAGAPLAVEFSQTYITVANQTGVPLVGGEIEIIPGGVLPPFKTTLPRIEAGGKREVLLNAFRGNDGTPYSRSIARARRVKITAKDQLGKVYQHEVPFN